MATLEKIRSHYVLLLVIIGVALLAFIIGDFFTSGRTLFGTGTTVAKVGSTKIDIQDFQREMERANQQVQASGRKVESAALQQQVLDGMISESLFKEELAKLGLIVTDQELTEMMLGTASAPIDQMVQQQMGVESARQLHDMAFNATKYNIPQETAQQLQQYWLQLEKQSEQMLLQQKFQVLFGGTIQANALDAKALYDENATTTHVAYAQKLYSTLPDSDKKYEVTDADIEKEWNAHKQRYAISEQIRTIDYIAVPIQPSEADITAGEKRVEDVLQALTASEGLEGISEMTEFLSDRRKVAVSSIRDTRLKSFADSAASGNVKLVQRMGNNFMIAKLFNRSVEVDSVNIDMVMVQGTKQSVDSVLTALRSGLKIDSLGRFEGVKGAQDSIWISMLDPQLGNYKKAIAEAQTGVYFNADTASTQGGMILRVNNRRPAVTMVDIAQIDYTIEPSAATVNTLQAKLQEYINANPTAKTFADNAQKAGYQVFPTRVSVSTPGITGVSDSRDVVAWAMDAKKDKVSPVFGSEQTGNFVAAALTGIYDDFIPASDRQVNTALKAEVLKNKKAEDMIAQFKGKAKDIAGYAALMGTKVDSATVTFGQINIFNPGFAGAEPAAIASITPKGALTAPIKGNNGVVVMQVVDIEKAGRPYDFAEYATQYNSVRGAGALSRQLNALLLGNKKVKNNMLKFFKN